MQGGWSEMAQATSSTQFRFAVVTDLHIIDEFYVKKSGVEHNGNILHPMTPLILARSLFNLLRPIQAKKVALS